MLGKIQWRWRWFVENKSPWVDLSFMKWPSDVPLSSHHKNCICHDHPFLHMFEGKLSNTYILTLRQAGRQAGRRAGGRAGGQAGRVGGGVGGEVGGREGGPARQTDRRRHGERESMSLLPCSFQLPYWSMRTMWWTSGSSTAPRTPTGCPTSWTSSLGRCRLSVRRVSVNEGNDPVNEPWVYFFLESSDILNWTCNYVWEQRFNFHFTLLHRVLDSYC